MKHEPELSDAEIIARVQNGDVQAYGALVSRHHTRLFGTVRSLLHNREDAHDVTQEVFLKAFEHLHHFRGSHFYAWVRKMGRNLAISRLRSRALWRMVSLESTHEEPTCHSSPHHDLEHKQLLDRIVTAVRELPQNQRQVFIMREIEGLSFKEISQVCRMPVSTVTVQNFRARQALMAALREKP